MAMTFVQIIEMTSSRPDELDALYREWLTTTEGRRTMSREMHMQDRDKPSHFVDVVEFPSYEKAMLNNDLPETQRLAERMRALCDSPPRFLNLDLLRDDNGNGSAR